jgi:hypothetical protein
MLQGNRLELVIIITIVKNTKATVKAFLLSVFIFSSHDKYYNTYKLLEKKKRRPSLRTASEAKGRSSLGATLYCCQA